MLEATPDEEVVWSGVLDGFITYARYVPSSFRFSREIDMYSLDNWLSLTMRLSDSSGLPLLTPLLGYVGLGQGPELIPYFLSLLTFMAAALIAVLQWPLSVLVRRFSQASRRGADEAMAADAAQAPASNGPLRYAEEGAPNPGNPKTGN